MASLAVMVKAALKLAVIGLIDFIVDVKIPRITIMKKQHLKPNIKAFTIALTLAVSLQASITPANAGGIPVIDVANLANTLENIVQWGKQLQAMKEQYAQQLAQYQSMTGKRGFGTVLNDPNLRQYLPADGAVKILSAE